MLISSQSIGLRNGRQVNLTVVRAPDDEWAERIEPLLAHKGEPWAGGDVEVWCR